jgi:hypothetical protein
MNNSWIWLNEQQTWIPTCGPGTVLLVLLKNRFIVSCQWVFGAAWATDWIICVGTLTAGNYLNFPMNELLLLMEDMILETR